MSKITILGSGGWGTALAIMADRWDHEVTLYSPFHEEIEQIRENKENIKLLPGIKIPDTIHLTTDIQCAGSCDLLILAMPSFAIRDTLKSIKAVLQPETILVNVAKGIEDSTLLRLSEVMKEEIPDNPVVVLSGPSHAEEVARGIPTTVVVSSQPIDAAERVQEILMNPLFRIYLNNDLVGVELGGALKNIIALAAGVCDGLGLGDNTKAALMTRGLTEMARLGVAMGGEKNTFAGLSGIGDLIVTCTSMHSRNRRCGILIGQGMPAQEAVEAVGMTVEGYHATKTAYKLAKKYNVEMPIVSQCYYILFKGIPPMSAINNLMQRPSCHEGETSWNLQ